VQERQQVPQRRQPFCDGWFRWRREDHIFIIADNDGIIGE
jgi:hypothetical protein